MNFFDGWFALNSRFDEGDLTAQTQLVGYKLFAIFNERKFPDSLLLTDRELQSRTNIKSGRTIVEARRSLKNAGLIDFETVKNKPTRYRLTIEPSKHQVSTEEAQSKHEVSTKEASGLVPYTHVREDVKTEDVKTKIIPITDAGARDLDKVEDYWQELGGGRLTVEHLSKLEVCLNQHGLDWVMEAMKEAADSNGSRFGASPKYLFAVIAGKKKGGERREQREQPKPAEQPFTVPENPVYIPPALRPQYNEWVRKNSGTA